MPIQLQEVDQNVRNAFMQNASANRRWWSLIAIIMSLMHFIVQCYQFTPEMVMKVKQIIVLSVNVNQVWTIIMTIVDHMRRQVQRRNQITTIKTIRPISIVAYVRPVQCALCYMRFRCDSLHVTQSIIISITCCTSCQPHCQLQLLPSLQEWQHHSRPQPQPVSENRNCNRRKITDTWCTHVTTPPPRQHYDESVWNSGCMFASIHLWKVGVF